MRYTLTGWSRRNVELFESSWSKPADVRHVSGTVVQSTVDILKKLFLKTPKNVCGAFLFFTCHSRTYLEIWKRTKLMEYERLILCFSLLSGIKYCKVITVIRIDHLQWDLLGKPVRGSCLAWFGLFIRLLCFMFFLIWQYLWDCLYGEVWIISSELSLVNGTFTPLSLVLGASQIWVSEWNQRRVEMTEDAAF